MRVTVVMFTGLFGGLLAAMPAQAQNSLSSTNNPPSPNSSMAAPQSTNSLPSNAGAVTTYSRPGSDIATTRVQPRTQGQTQIQAAPAR